MNVFMRYFLKLTILQLILLPHLNELLAENNKTNIPNPNARVIFDGAFLLESPEKSSPKILSLHEGDAVRISKKRAGPFIQTMVIVNGKKHIGWMHLENLNISAKLRAAIGPITPDGQEQTGNENEKYDPRKPDNIRKFIEKTLVLPKGRSLSHLGLRFKQNSYDTSANATFSSSAFALAYQNLLGISNNLTLDFTLSYLVYNKTRLTSENSKTNLKTKGFEDFIIGFKYQLLSQKSVIDLIVQAGWVSGFMPNDLPVASDTGGAGSGSHDFYMGFMLGKSFRALSPYFQFKATQIGGTTRHTADNSLTIKYSSKQIYDLKLGFEFPQLLPQALIAPYFKFNYSAAQDFESIDAPTEKGYSKAKQSFGGGLNFFLYRGRKTIIFTYDLELTGKYKEKNYLSWATCAIEKETKHFFSLQTRY